MARDFFSQLTSWITLSARPPAGIAAVRTRDSTNIKLAILCSSECSTARHEEFVLEVTEPATACSLQKKNYSWSPL